MRLNLGCGRDYREGWVNVDHPKAQTKHDAPWDMDSQMSPFGDDSVEHSEGSHVLEHLHHPLHFMEQLWLATKPGGTARFLLPYGSSDDAWEDPTHVRPWFINSFAPFAAPYYWRADYGYKGDWQPKLVILKIDCELGALSDQNLLKLVATQRNIVNEMEVLLEAVKPRRPPDREMQQPARLQFHFEGVQQGS